MIDLFISLFVIVVFALAYVDFALSASPDHEE